MINAALPVILAGVLNLYSGKILITAGLTTVVVFSASLIVEIY
jgi:hypothetical protein